MTEGRRPTFIGVGAQKCASTWLHRMLEGSAQVAVSNPKELDFFSRRFDRGYDWYERHFATSTTAAGEISPSYFYDAAAVERARDYNPDFRIIVALRDPVERMFSNHLHEWRKGHLDAANIAFEDAFARNPLYLEQSLYATHLERWLQAFDPDRICIFLQEEIAGDPAREAARLFAFLGVDEKPCPEFLHRRANENVVYKNAAVGAVYARAGAAVRAVGLAGALARAKRAPGLSRIWTAAKKNVRDEVPAMRPETARRLRRRLAPEMRALARLIGRDDLPWPNWPGAFDRAA